MEEVRDCKDRQGAIRAYRHQEVQAEADVAYYRSIRRFDLAGQAWARACQARGMQKMLKGGVQA